jgi:hypothetical protein
MTASESTDMQLKRYQLYTNAQVVLTLPVYLFANYTHIQIQHHVVGSTANRRDTNRVFHN